MRSVSSSTLNQELLSSTKLWNLESSQSQTGILQLQRHDSAICAYDNKSGLAGKGEIGDRFRNDLNSRVEQNHSAK
jgi:hypothetical protein